MRYLKDFSKPPAKPHMVAIFRCPDDALNPRRVPPVPSLHYVEFRGQPSVRYIWYTDGSLRYMKPRVKGISPRQLKKIRRNPNTISRSTRLRAQRAAR